MDEASHTPTPIYDSADEYRPEPEPEPEPLPWCDGSVRIGIHTSIAGDMTGALESARKLGCNALQIFSASPRMWPRPGSRISDADAVRFRARRGELGLGPLVVHANYLINLASPDRVMRARSIQAFHDEMVRARALQADFLVVHPGSDRGQDRAQAVRDVAEGLHQAARGIRFGVERFGELHRGGLRVLLENTSGMGSTVGARFEELREILDLAPDLPLGICLDTAHAFEAGYEIHTEAGLEQVVGALDSILGLDRVAVVHVNDSKTPFGSRVDRHEHIGQGQIGLGAFRRILNHSAISANIAEGLPGRAFILETPLNAPGDDRRNVRTLWALVGIQARQAPRAENGFSMLRRGRGSSVARPAAEPARKKKAQRTKKESRKAAKSPLKRRG
jgi:deoxyribonuclease IV